MLSMFIGGVSAYITFLNKEESSELGKARDEDKRKIDNLYNDKNLTPIKAELTAYCNCEECSEEWGSITAMQTQTRIGVVAAPKEIKLGSKIYIPILNDYTGDGIFYVEDRGGAVKIKDDGTYIIDVWISDHDEVVNFGRKPCTVYLYN